MAHRDGNDFTLARAERGDAARIAPLFDAYRGFYGKPSDLAGALRFLEARVANAEALAFVARSTRDPDSELLGFSLVYPTISSVSMSRAWVLNDLFVRASVRRLGVGRALARFVLDEARRAGAAYVELATQLTNTSARELYESEGFKQDAEFAHYTIELRGGVGS